MHRTLHLPEQLGTYKSFDLCLSPAHKHLKTVQTVGVKLIVQNRTIFNDVLLGDKVCLDDTSLLELLTYIPVLLPFKAIIDYLIEVPVRPF